MLSENTPRCNRILRIGERWALRYAPPALVRLDENNEFQTETQNVSAREFLLPRPSRSRRHSLRSDPHLPAAHHADRRRPRPLHRPHHPLRIPLPSARVGTAAMIEDYEFLRSTGSTDFLSALQRNWKPTN